MFKKIISLILAVMMIMSVVTVMATSTGALELDSKKLYFDAGSTGWTLGSKDKIGFYVFGKDGELLPWGGKKLNGTDEGNGIWSYDPAAKGMNIQEGEQYKIIFTGASNQTYDLIFDTTCFGHIAYCDGTEYENPVDSSKKALAAFWKDIDPTTYGPFLQVSSIGTVVGTCYEEGADASTVFTDFLKNNFENAKKFKVETGEMTEQVMIDTIGAGLGLTKDQAADAFTATGVTTTWSADDSTLPGGETPHTHTPGEPVQENVVPASCKEEGSYDEVIYCTECGEEISREAKTIDKLAHTPGEPTQDMMAGHPATCEEAGVKVMVTTCTECGAEISRENVEILPLGHDRYFVEEVPATSIDNGVKAHYACKRCDKLFDAEDQDKEVTMEDLIIEAEHIRGDADRSGEVDITDVTQIQRYLAEIVGEDAIDLIAADADRDGEVTIIDATLIQRVLLDICNWDKIPANK